MAAEHARYLVRPVREEDMAAVMGLAKAVGKGMTTLPADDTVIGDMIRRSLDSFSGEDPSRFTIVLEEQDAGVVGIASVIVRAGGDHGFYSYKRTRLQNHSGALDRTVTARIMSLANDYTTATEVGTLFILPEHRPGGNGRFLARSRYMLMACAPDRFSDIVMAEMRGWQTDDGRSPFWDAVGSRFFRMQFEEADALSATQGNRFIAELLPRLPIYEDLLPEEVQAIIGKPHAASAPAMKMLLDEGFADEGYVDIFDSGPCLHTRLANIATIARSTLAPCASSGKPASADTLCLVAPDDLATFRCVRAPVSGGATGAEIPGEAAEALQVVDAHSLRFSPL